MPAKNDIAGIFEKNRGRFVSGQEMAEELGISRTAVWKAVNSLRNEGYCIDAVSNKGYRLAESSDVLSVSGIEKYLDARCNRLKFTVLRQTTSTNDVLKDLASNGAKAGTVIVAAEQKSGKGRSGKSFVSPPDTGVYMSLLLRPDRFRAADSPYFTTMAAVAGCEAVEEVSNKKAEIKWVNDIYVEGKKVSGILTEGSLSVESGLLEVVILGIGFNAYAPRGGFPDEIKNIAGAVYDKQIPDGKNRLAAAFFNNFIRYYEKENKWSYVPEYRKRCFVIGKKVRLYGHGKEQVARAVGLDDTCRLKIRYSDGRESFLDSGEISINF